VEDCYLCRNAVQCCCCRFAPAVARSHLAPPNDDGFIVGLHPTVPKPGDNHEAGEEECQHERQLNGHNEEMVLYCAVEKVQGHAAELHNERCGHQVTLAQVTAASQRDDHTKTVENKVLRARRVVSHVGRR